MTRRCPNACVLALAGLICTSAALAQPKGAPADAFDVTPSADPSRPPKISPEQRLQERLRQAMEISDVEWQVLGPKIERILTLQRQRDRFERPKPPPPPRPPKGGKQDQPDPAAAPQAGTLIIDIKPDPKRDAPAGTVNGELAEQFTRLATLATDARATNDELKMTLARVRDARTKSARELAQARAELRELVTIKQETVLVVLGILD